MTYYDKLITEWNALTGTTAEKLAAINAMTVPGADRAVPITEIMQYLRSNGLWPTIKIAGDLFASSGGAQGSVGAWAAVDYNSDTRNSTLDVSLPATQGMLADLVSKSLLTQAQVNAIVALKATTVPWWQANGYTSPFSENDLVAAGISQ